MATRDIVIDRDLLQVLDCIDSIRDEALQLLHQQEQLHLDIKNIHNLPDNTIQNSKSQSRLVSKGSQLRGLYRRAIMSTRTTKQTTSQARAEVDNLYLQLQNITYEQTHLKGEISACEGYPHQYANLPLMPVDEYLSLFPDKADLDDHELTIARITHEHSQRQMLEEQRQGLLKRKQALIAENNRRKEDLANLDKDLEKFIEAADPIIKTFEKEY